MIRKNIKNAFAVLLGAAMCMTAFSGLSSGVNGLHNANDASVVQAAGNGSDNNSNAGSNANSEDDSKASGERKPEYKNVNKKTIKNFLMTGLEPMGTTMYLYGGGWNEEDTGAGTEARTIGLSPRWAEFASKQTSSYNYKDYNYKTDPNVIHDGLDCSGYVGWVLYNTLETEDGKEGYVDYNNKVLERLQSEGYGTITKASNVTDYKPGDIMKTPDHVWIVVGPCDDGSVVLMHSSPPGVQFSGTPTPSGKTSSEAVTIAAYYKEAYYKSWYNRYPSSSKGMSYLSGYDQFRWTTSGSDSDGSSNNSFSDPEGYQNMTAVEVLKNLFGTYPPGYEKSGASGTWKKDSKGWWFEYTNGSYPVSNWEQISGNWYYFNSSGYMTTGWQKVGDTWYYMDSDGAMKTGWVKSSGIWYYLTSSGAMATGWVQDGTTWYYMNSSGAMQTGWVKSGSHWYYLKSSGAMAANEKINGYYVNSNGEWDGK